METTLKKVPPFFEGKGEVEGYSFKNVFESKNWYIYEVKTESKTHFEVFKKRFTKICIDFEKKIFSDDLREIYPNSKQFGFTAWTAGTLERAKEIMQEKDSTNER